MTFFLLQMKAIRGQDMASSDGQIRLLFATEAYSMGVDAPDISRVVHAGPPSSVESKSINISI